MSNTIHNVSVAAATDAMRCLGQTMQAGSSDDELDAWSEALDLVLDLVPEDVRAGLLAAKETGASEARLED